MPTLPLEVTSVHAHQLDEEERLFLRGVRGLVLLVVAGNLGWPVVLLGPELPQRFVEARERLGYRSRAERASSQMVAGQQFQIKEMARKERKVEVVFGVEDVDPMFMPLLNPHAPPNFCNASPVTRQMRQSGIT